MTLPSARLPRLDPVAVRAPDDTFVALTAHIAELAEQHATPTKAMHSYRTHEGIKHV